MVIRWGVEEFCIALDNFIDRTKKVIECKAIITANAVGIEKLDRIDNLLFCTYLQEHPKKYCHVLGEVNKNCVIFCFAQEHVDYIKKFYPNIINVICIPFSVEVEDPWLIAFSHIALEIQDQVAIRQGTSSILKLLIQRGLDCRNLQEIGKLIAKYRERNPDDMDLVSMETICNLYCSDIDSALKYALEGVKKYPFSADMYYNLASVYEKQEDWYNALINYGKAWAIYTYIKDPRIKKLGLSQLVSNCRRKYEEQDNGKFGITYYDIHRGNFWLDEAAFRDVNQQIVGGYFWESETEKRYVGIYRDYFLRTKENNLDLVHMKGEFLKVIEGNEYYIKQTDTEVLLPIAVENNGTIHEIWDGEKRYKIFQEYSKHFNYYRLPAGAKVCSSMKTYYGNPIPLCQRADKKKLVLNIFVDGLAQYILNNEDFERSMPYTAKFFNDGIVCKNAYSTAEWTYPSLANYITGVDTTHHMLFHNELESAIPKDYPTLAEYFQEKGYFTSAIGGNWRAIPNYGHARGYDQFVYQNESVGFKEEMLIGEVIDHIEAFKETNQFLWITIGDLHDIADELDLPNSVQSNMRLEERVQEEKSATSVKQNYSVLKIMAFKRMLKRVDMLLNILYQYLEINYEKEDIIVSLFADHGQGYMVRSDEHFMSKGRSNVAFMFRGAEIKAQKCDEIISTSDYIKIMCKLANIKMKDVKIDGVLPKAFGGEGREYALSESIHPHDPYYAAIFAEDVNFYFENPFPVQDDGRFYLKEYNAWITDKQGNRISDWKKYNKYLNIIIEHIKPLLIYD